MKAARPIPAASAAPTPLTLDALFKEKIFETTRLRDPHWMQDGQRFSYLAPAPDSEAVTVWMYETATGERKPIVDIAKLKLPKEDLPSSIKPEEEEGDGDEEDGGN